jgi:hypothetical protein
MSMMLLQETKQDLWQKGYSQVEGLDFDETFAPVARLESIPIYLPMLVTMISSFIKWMSRVLS